jgi:hypothetical protein
MSWKDLLQSADEITVLPWVGGRSIQSSDRTWHIDGNIPREHGWFSFKISARKAMVDKLADATPEILKYPVRGYLVGDRVIPDNIRVDPDPTQIIAYSEQVYLIEPGLDRFVRIAAGRICDNGPLVYQNQEMPLGPEEEVAKAYQDRIDSVNNIQNVPPALDAAFRMETWYRAEADKRRAEIERRRREEEERRIKEERRQQLIQQLGDAAGRRAMTNVDFGEAARAALAMGGAEYLDHRRSYNRGEMVVTFRVGQRRFECTCDKNTLQIIEAGICLTDHASGERGDTYFTLESLPGVIREAEHRRVLHVFRHVDGVNEDDEGEDW